MTQSECGDCLLPIIESCKCSEHLRICEEQQRAERAEEMWKRLEGYVKWDAYCPYCGEDNVCHSDCKISDEFAAVAKCINRARRVLNHDPGD